MNVSVTFYAHLRDLVDKKSKMGFDLKDGATVSNLVDELILDSKIKQHLLDESGAVKSDITLLKNGREIKFLNGMETLLESGDEIQIFPMVAGG
ncbi:MAG: ubiquitin-like small modifier protein 1 [Candidatus Thorarchaeota archaeon]